MWAWNSSSGRRPTPMTGTFRVPRFTMAKSAGKIFLREVAGGAEEHERVRVLGGGRCRSLAHGKAPSLEGRRSLRLRGLAEPRVLRAQRRPRDGAQPLFLDGSPSTTHRPYVPSSIRLKASRTSRASSTRRRPPRTPRPRARRRRSRRPHHGRRRRPDSRASVPARFICSSRRCSSASSRRLYSSVFTLTSARVPRR